MIAPKHTPGPWEYHEEDGSIRGHDGSLIADLEYGRDESDANGHLIAAAPGVLEALEVAERALDLRRQFEERDPSAHATLDPWTVSVAEAKARLGIFTIIAKARGDVHIAEHGVDP